MSQSKENGKRNRLTIPNHFVRSKNLEMAIEDQLEISVCTNTGRAIQADREVSE